MKNLIPLLLCAACASAYTHPSKAEDTCGATAYAELIGQDATALEKVPILGMVRVIRPGDMVTQDFRPTRINFVIGTDNSITAIKCG